MPQTRAKTGKLPHKTLGLEAELSLAADMERAQKSSLKLHRKRIVKEQKAIAKLQRKHPIRNPRYDLYGTTLVEILLWHSEGIRVDRLLAFNPCEEPSDISWLPFLEGVWDSVVFDCNDARLKHRDYLKSNVSPPGFQGLSKAAKSYLHHLSTKLGSRRSIQVVD